MKAIKTSLLKCSTKNKNFLNELLKTIISGKMSTDTSSATSCDIRNLRVEHNERTNKFFIKLDANREAFIQYRRTGKQASVIDLFHTETPIEHRGKGIAKVLAKGAFEYVSREGLKMKLSCTYLQDYQKKFADSKFDQFIAQNTSRTYKSN